MRNVSTYGKLTNDELREELVLVTSALAAHLEGLGMALADYHREYLLDYSSSAESSAIGKNRVAQYTNREAATIIIQDRAKANSLTLCRDLLVFLLLSREPGVLPFPTIAKTDDNDLPVV